MYRPCSRQGMRAKTVTGSTSASERVAVKNSMRAGLLDVVCLCGCWNEGMSEPIVSTVVFAEPRMSVQNVFQVLMRGGRPDPRRGKPFFHVVFVSVGEADVGATAEQLRTLVRFDERIASAVARLRDGRPTNRLAISTRVEDDSNGESADGGAPLGLSKFVGDVLIRDLLLRPSTDARIRAIATLEKRPPSKATPIATDEEGASEFAPKSFVDRLLLNRVPEEERTEGQIRKLGPDRPSEDVRALSRRFEPVSTRRVQGKADSSWPLRSSRRRCAPTSKMCPFTLQSLRPCFGQGDSRGRSDGRLPPGPAGRGSAQSIRTPRRTSSGDISRASTCGRNTVDRSRGRMALV